MEREARTARTDSRGIASPTLPFPATVVAWNSALYTASSVASTTAWKSGDISSLPIDAVGGCTREDRRTAGEVENAMM